MLGFGLGLNKWRRVGGGFVGLLDLYPNAAFAPSIRLLRKNYSGGLVRARAWDGLANQGEADVMAYRVSSTEYLIDLNSTLENLDATAIGRGLTTSDTLADLVSTGASDYDGLVSAWYDQSLSNNATQSTAAAQPKIVSGGSLVTENGKPAIDFDGVDDCFILDSKITISTTVLFVDVMSNIGVGFSAPYGSNNSSNGVYFPRSRSLFQGNGFSDNSSVVDLYGSQSVTSISSVSGIYNIYQNGVVRGSSGTYTGNTVSTMMVRRSSDLLGITSGKLQERIIYNNSDQSANRTGIESNQATFYGITL
jgi:hypothetical protein